MGPIRRLILLLCFANVSIFAATESYDHFLHGFDLDGGHRYVRCESCHVQGVFAGTPRQCARCHDGSGIYAESAPSASHPPTTPACESCHTTANWTALIGVDHAEVVGSCSTCHNGQMAGGLPTSHFQTSAECDTCHNDVAWRFAVFDHANVTGNCMQCHNGIKATGKSAMHINTTDVCEDCHATQFWAPAVSVDHTQVVGMCASCHNGVAATGKNVNHVPSGDNCDDCHTTAAWTPAVFDHNGVTPGTCNLCHDGTSATGKHPQHVSTTAQCDVCHTAVAWIPAMFDHSGVAPGTCSMCHDGAQATGMGPQHFQSMLECDTCHSIDFWSPDVFVHTSADYPGDHARNPACTGCHQTNAEQVTWLFPAYAPNCAGCHADSFKIGPHKKYETPRTQYTVAELTDCSGACHVYQDATLTNIKKLRPGWEHTVNKNGW